MALSVGFTVKVTLEITIFQKFNII